MLRLRPLRRSTVVALLRDRRGIAAFEFALVLPLLLLVLIGVVDCTRAVIASRKLNLLSRTVADLVSQKPTTGAPLAISELTNIFAASTAVMAPFPTGSLTLTVSALDIKAKADKTCCDVVVRWSFTQSGTLRSCTPPLVQVADGTAPTPANFPRSLVTANQAQGFGYAVGAVSYVIVADATYTYAPVFSQAASWFSAGMSKTSFMVPRASANPVTIASPGAAAAPLSGAVCFS